MAELVSGGSAGDQLDRFLAVNGAKSWQPGVVDCCLVLADWAMFCGEPDAACELRSRYDSEEGFRSLIAEAGGALQLVTACALKIRCRPVAIPSRGSIGVAGSPINIQRQFGVIHDGRGWLVRQRDGWARLSARTLAAWSFNART